MKDFNYKIMNEAQISEVNELWKDHGEAIAAYGLECVSSYKRGHAFGVVVAAGAGLLAGLGYLGVKAYKKWKSKKKEPENKYEDKRDYMVI